MSDQIRLEGKTREVIKRATGDNPNSPQRKIFEDVVSAPLIEGRDVGKKPIPFERQKTIEETEYIQLTLSFLQNDRKRLGLHQTNGIEIDRIRFLREEAVSQGKTQMIGRGQYHSGFDVAFSQAPRDNNSPFTYYRTTSHETVHTAAALSTDPLGQNLYIGHGWAELNARCGTGVDEALTELTNQRSIATNFDTLFEKYGGEVVDGKKILPWNSDPSYQRPSRVVELVARKIDQRTLLPDGTAMDNFMCFYYTRDERYQRHLIRGMSDNDWIMLNLLESPRAFMLRTFVDENGLQDIKSGMIQLNERIYSYFSAPDGSTEKARAVHTALTYLEPETLQHFRDQIAHLRTPRFDTQELNAA